MKRSLHLLLGSCLLLNSASIAEAANHGCLGKKLSSLPIVKRAFGPTRNQLISQNQQLNGKLNSLSQKLEEMQLALEEKNAQTEKQAAEIQSLNQTLAAARKAGEDASLALKKTKKALGLSLIHI